MSGIQYIEELLFRTSPTIALLAASLLSRAASRSSGYQETLIATERALRAAGLFSPELLEKLRQLTIQQVAERKLVRFGTPEYLRKLQRDVTGEGIDEARRALLQGQGLILGCTHIGVFYHALIQARRICTDLLVVTGNQNYSESVVDRLRVLSNVNIRIMPASTRSALAITRQLRRGGVVATMLDHYVDTTLSADIPFFGRPSKTPIGIFQIAVASNTPILPIAVTYFQHGRSVETSRLIESTGNAIDLATKVNAVIESMVRKNPDLWGKWCTLEQRWSAS